MLVCVIAFLYLFITPAYAEKFIYISDANQCLSGLSVNRSYNSNGIQSKDYTFYYNNTCDQPIIVYFYIPKITDAGISTVADTCPKNKSCQETISRVYYQGAPYTYCVQWQNFQFRQETGDGTCGSNGKTSSIINESTLTTTIINNNESSYNGGNQDPSTKSVLEKDMQGNLNYDRKSLRRLLLDHGEIRTLDRVYKISVKGAATLTVSNGATYNGIWTTDDKVVCLSFLDYDEATSCNYVKTQNFDGFEILTLGKFIQKNPFWPVYAVSDQAEDINLGIAAINKIQGKNKPLLPEVNILFKVLSDLDTSALKVYYPAKTDDELGCEVFPKECSDSLNEANASTIRDQSNGTQNASVNFAPNVITPKNDKRRQIFNSEDITFSVNGKNCLSLVEIQREPFNPYEKYTFQLVIYNNCGAKVCGISPKGRKTVIDPIEEIRNLFNIEANFNDNKDYSKINITSAMSATSLDVYSNKNSSFAEILDLARQSRFTAISNYSECR